MEDTVKMVFFDIDDTLYDSSRQTEQARKNAIKAMIEAGLDVREDEAFDVLHEIVKEFSSNYQYQFDELIRGFGYDYNPRIVAAGVVAYHTTKVAYLVPFPDTIPTLLRLRDGGYSLGIITNGIAVKQWEKLIRLGVQHFFHSVVISGDAGSEKPDPKLFEAAMEKVECTPGEAMMVGDRLDRDIKGANEAGMITVQMLREGHRCIRPRDESEEPDYIISRLSDIIKILENCSSALDL